MKKTLTLSAFILLTMAYSQAQTNTFPSSGNVGIGTTTPQQALHVKGRIYLEGTESSNGWAQNYFHWRAHSLIMGTEVGNYAHNEIEIKPGGSTTGILHSFLSMYTSPNENVHEKKIFLTTSGNSFFNGGNVGIGTAAPGGALSFTDNNQTTQPVGITWYNPIPTLYGIHRTAGSWTAPNYQQLRLGWATGIVLDPGTGSGKSYVEIAGDGLRVTSGNVGIGTTDTKGYRLAVNGSAIFTSVKVKSYSAWPDYVFDADYVLPSLNDVEAHIKCKGHLADVPSAKEVKENGLDVGESQGLLLRKIEELTLYVIQQQKEINELRKAIKK